MYDEFIIGGASPEVHPRAPMHRRVGNMTVSCGDVCGSHAHFLAIGLGGLGRRLPVNLLVGVVSPHAPLKCVFQNTTLRPCYEFRDAREFFP